MTGAFTLPSLRQAWAEVLANDLADGVPAPGVTRFQERLDWQLTRLERQLAAGTYHPQPLTEVPILKPDGGTRVLHVPTVRDRIVARAILDAVNPLVDPHLGCAAYAYRPGLGVVDAVEAVVDLRESGAEWVLRTDVDDCFPTIPVDLARRRFGALVGDPAILDVLDLLLARPASGGGGWGRGGGASGGGGGVRGGGGRHTRRAIRGLAQGCALSPLLSNLVLADLDAALLDRGHSVVRYADDLCVGAATRDEAWEAARCASGAVEELGMALGADKTQVMSFAEGFTFLGEDFGPRYPPALTEARVDEPDRKVVYAAAQGSGVRVSKGRLLVESADGVELLSVPVTQVGRIVTFGAVGVSAGTRSWAVKADVDVVFASRRGSYEASLVGASSGPRVSRLRRQVAVSEPGSTQALSVAIAIVDSKITKQVILLRRLGDPATAESVASAVSSMEGFARMLPECRTTSEVMGLEGAAAAAYFPALGELMPPDLRFTTRSRQPPLDLANAGLSFLYTILLGECVTALYAAGLDPALGLLHSDKDRRPSLALDLMEEFRPLIVDQVVAEAARQGRLRADHARADGGGILLTKAGQTVLLDGYERRMLRRTRGALPDFAGTWRRHLYRQAQRLCATIMDPAHTWTGLSWRP